MSSSVVDIFDPDTGEPVKYKRVSARLPAFNQQYSPENGYAIESEMRDSLSLQPARLALLREAIASGKTPSAVGLGDLDAGLVMVCTHRLLDKDGRIVRDASAAKHIAGLKDYEILETASLQRLMAKLGHGGEIFDDDEDQDIAAQGLNAPPSASVTPLVVEPVEDGDGPERTETVPATPAPSVVATSDAEPEADAPPTGVEEPSEVPPAMLRQIANLAAGLDEDPPKVTTFAEAKMALKDLSDRRRESTKPTKS